MKVVKSVKFRYKQNEEVLKLLESFRLMVNDAIRVGLELKVRSRFRLWRLCYHDLRQRYGLHHTYANAACEVAFSILKKHHKWQRRPYVSRLMLRIDDCRAYRLFHLLLRIPITGGTYTFLQLRGGDYQLRLLSDPSVKIGALQIMPDSIDVMISREVTAKPTSGKAAYDLNVRNVTGVSTSSDEPVVYDLSAIPDYAKKAGVVLSHFRRNDHRVAGRLKRKYGRKLRNKTRAKLDVVSKRIVESAATNHDAIVLEDLRNIRGSHPKSKRRESARLRRTIHGWPFFILQRAIVYKAAWEEIPVEFVSPRNTSKTCSRCGWINRKLRYQREWQCPSCGVVLSRDINAARNLLNRSLVAQAVRFAVGGLACEAMGREAPRGALPTVDASQLGSPSGRAGDSAESVV